MAIRCMRIDHRMQKLHITHPALPMQITEAMIRDTTVCHHLEHSSILKLNTEIPTTLRMDLILNITKEILVTHPISWQVIRMAGSFTLRDLLHKVHQG